MRIESHQIELEETKPTAAADDPIAAAAQKSGITLHSAKGGWIAKVAGGLSIVKEFAELEEAENWAAFRRYNIHGIYNR